MIKGTDILNLPSGSTLTLGPSALPHPAKLPVCTKLYGPVRDEATACSMYFLPLDSAFAKMWYWLLDGIT